MKSPTSFARNEVFMALPIFYGYSPTSLKYAWHHLSPGGIFLYLASLSYIISLLSGVVSHHVFEIWTTSTSSRMMIDYISEVGVASSFLYGHVRAMSKFLVACFDIFKVFVAYSGVFKGLASFFPHLQGFVGIFLHLQSLDRDSLHLQHLVGISKILMSGYSTIHPRCLSYVTSENLC